MEKLISNLELGKIKIRLFSLLMITTGILAGVSAAQAQAGNKPCLDFYGTGKTSFSVTTTENNVIVWRLRSNGSAESDNFGFGSDFGSSSALTDDQTPGYFDNDNKADVNVWRNGTYYLRPSTGTSPTRVVGIPFGNGTTDAPTFEGDYDGDGRTDPTVLRVLTVNGTNTIYWYYLRSSNGTLGVTPFGRFPAITAQPELNDQPMKGVDWTGDGRADLAVIRYNDNTGVGHSIVVGDSVTGNTVIYQPWGDFDTDYYVLGDYVGDSRADFVVWRGFADGTWWIKENGGTGQVTTRSFGYPEGATSQRDIAVCGDYDGNGKSDIAVYRRSNDTFYWMPNLATPTVTGQYTMTVPANTAPFTAEVPVGRLYAY